jgi:hypothetical protein
MTRPANMLPISCPPCGLRHGAAAEYIGVKTTIFDEMVADGRMPKPKRVNSLPIWGRLGLDAAFAALPTDDDANPWDK